MQQEGFGKVAASDMNSNRRVSMQQPAYFTLATTLLCNICTLIKITARRLWAFVFLKFK
jgi:hypothetical protein